MSERFFSAEKFGTEIIEMFAAKKKL